MASPRSHTILLVDDDAMMHELARAYLENSGYRLLSAFDGVAGLQAILTHRPDLVLLDYMMPEMSGEMVFAELTSHPRFQAVKDTPVIMLTARDVDESMKAIMLESGVSAYLQKPFGLRELTNVIENVFIIHDIRLRNRQLGSEIASTRDYLELLMHTAPIGIFSTDAKGCLRHLNPMLSQLLGCESMESCLGRSVFDEPNLRETFLRTAVARVLTGQSPWKIRNLHFLRPPVRPRVLNVHSVPLRGASGELEGVVAVVEDVTETQKREEQLQMLSTIGLALQTVIDLDDLLHLILTSITAGPALGFTRAMIFLMDRAGRHLVGKMGVGPSNEEEAHAAWEALASEHISLEDFLEKYGKRRPKIPSAFDEVVRRQSFALDVKDSDFLIQILHRRTYRGTGDQPDRPAGQKILRALELTDFVAVPLVAQDRLIGLIMADNRYSSQAIDEEQVSLLELFASQAAQAIEKADAYRHLELEKRKLEHAYQELQLTHQRLLHAERLATIGQMAAHVAHEIRNPLVTIGGFARALNRQSRDQEAVESMTGIIADEVVRLEKILTDVLEFSRLPQSSRQAVHLNNIVEEVCALLLDEAKTNGVIIHQKLGQDIPSIRLDAVQINQLMMNLIRNGIQAMPEGGGLEVRTMRLPNRKVRITVKDSGCGIPPEVMEDIFKPFFTTKAHGTGLGLAICRQIIHDHDGEIDVHSTLDQGTTFIVDLPLEQQPVPVKREPDASEEEALVVSPYLA